MQYTAMMRYLFLYDVCSQKSTDNTIYEALNEPQVVGLCRGKQLPSPT